MTARPVFGSPETGRPPVPLLARPPVAGPIDQLCTDPKETAPIGIPCHRCLANAAPPGAPVACHFLRSTP